MMTRPKAQSGAEGVRLPDADQPYVPKLSQAGRALTKAVSAIDEKGRAREVHVAGEYPLTLVVDGVEIVTLMTIGANPEMLALGFLRNQRLIEDIEDIASVEVDWREEQTRITTLHGRGLSDQEAKLSGRTVTTGCGQGTVFAHSLDMLYETCLPSVTVFQSTIVELLREISDRNQLYKKAGAVHGCGLCKGSEVRIFVEDVGRHNAADAISGMMWIDRIDGGDKIFYTTGRLTSEIVMKTALMGIPILLSRSGITQMGLELAQHLGMIMVARARAGKFLVYNLADRVVFDLPKS